MLVCISAASCGGIRPIVVGWMPLWSTRHGTSTQHSVGRFEINDEPVPDWSFITLPYTTVGSPVSIALMIDAPYSTDGLTSIVDSGSSIVSRSTSHPAI